MECPKCGKADTKVVDSKLVKEENSVRNQRECSACSNKFTTYEVTEENLLPFLVRKNIGDGPADSDPKKALALITNILQLMSEQTGKPAEKVAKAATPQPEKKTPEEKPQGKKSKAPVAKPSEKKTDASDVDDATATDTVLKIIRKNKKGVDVAELKKKTGFNDKKIRNIVHRASKQGKIKRIGRGLYVIA